ncbi:hypothetical protein [Parafrankia elaeagni]|nr:hypothetical protein [Parafrankia elaeagni]
MQAALDAAGTDGDAGRLATEIRAYQAGHGSAARILTRHGYLLRESD